MALREQGTASGRSALRSALRGAERLAIAGAAFAAAKAVVKRVDSTVQARRLDSEERGASEHFRIDPDREQRGNVLGFIDF